MTDVRELQAIKGELTYADKVIEKIVGIALESVDGLLAVSGGFFADLKDKLVNTDTTRDGVHVEVGTKQVAVDLDIVAEYQKHVPTIYEAIKAVIETEVKRMTDLEVVEVNVNVVDIKTRAQYEADKVSLQVRVTDAASSAADFTSTQADKAAKGIGHLTESKEPRVI
ncbi:Asp23/Gls24 family envelope stress response protein [Streptococcus sp. X16XC17]|uniref:Asp23/Gls24 family envelope stress response protein n=1 Tax=unclassified Streptococcus TaxID=2608887 RepID=UPI00066FCD37|nr:MULTISPECIES: Asp23/Gls24 family envelope stress response protein [unclassified Streptococcus]TCD45936.1 Asp23/Gls24 family envelope stress response protein [Streptococcus sp. X16XC17]